MLKIIRRALDSEESFNLLLWGQPASSKTLFLLELTKQKGAVFVDCTNTTSRILDVLEQERPKIYLFDELDKMGRVFQNQLLNFLESGYIKVDQNKRQYDFTIKGAKVFATANDLNKLSAPLRSRFRRLHLPKYSREQFLQITVKVCPKLSEETALVIADETWEQHGDIRDVISRLSIHSTIWYVPTGIIKSVTSIEFLESIYELSLRCITYRAITLRNGYSKPRIRYNNIQILSYGG